MTVTRMSPLSVVSIWPTYFVGPELAPVGNSQPHLPPAGNDAMFVL